MAEQHALDRLEREDVESLRAMKARERFWREVGEAEVAGFTKDEAPMAVATWRVRGRASVDVVRAHWRATA